jgi:site-specific DNA-methyltransferase (adenine-specific)
MRLQDAGSAPTLDDDLVIAGDNLPVLKRLPEGAFDLIYVDPPFNTGRAQTRRSMTATADVGASRVGFGGRRYRTELLQSLSYDDAFSDYLGFLEPRLTRARELLAPHGTLYFHIDYREAHYCKLLLDEVFGRAAFLNEIIWAYDYGAKPRRRWPAKHDTILAYVRTPGAHHFDADAVEREPYMARGASAPPTCGSTRSSPPTAPRRPATRRRSPRGSCAGWWRHRHAPAAGAWIRLRGRAPWGRSARSWAGVSC